MALSSIKTLRELYTVPPVWFPEVPTLANYMKVLFDSNIPRYFLNSTIISLGSTAIALGLAIFASYGFARFRFRGKAGFQAFILIGQLLPTAAIIVPLFITLRYFRPGEQLSRPHPHLHDHHPAAVGVDADQLFPRDSRSSSRRRRSSTAPAASASSSASPCPYRCPGWSRSSSMPSSPPGTSSSSRWSSPRTTG